MLYAQKFIITRVAQYMKKIESEVPKAIIHQFTMSQPVSVTNDRIVFILFKDNIDLNQVKNFYLVQHLKNCTLCSCLIDIYVIFYLSIY